MKPIMETITLKPCPFCGGGASMRCGGPGCYYVQCDTCNATSYDHAEDHAIEVWNTRTDATKDAEIARLREALEFYSCNETNCECDPLGKNRNTLSCGYVARAALSPIPDPAGGMPVEVET